MPALQDSYKILDARNTAKYTMAVTVMMTGAAAHRIRRYEEAGLFKPNRTGNKQRLYSDIDIELIRRILVLEQEGVNLQGIKVILGMQANAKPARGVTI